MKKFLYNNPIIWRPVKIFYIYEYNPYWLYINGNKIRNPKFSSDDRAILDFKDNKPHAVSRFSKELVDIFDAFQNKNFFFCAVPSHDVLKTWSSVHELAHNLSEHYKITDFSKVLQRCKNIPKSAVSGMRNISLHINSLRVDSNYDIADKHLVLLDDVTTSGASLASGAHVLHNAGADKIICLSLGRTDN